MINLKDEKFYFYNDLAEYKNSLEGKAVIKAFKSNNLELIEKAYKDYLEFKKEIENLNYNFLELYNYLKNRKDIFFTNVELDWGYYDFNYKDMTLTINNNKDNKAELSPTIEIWDDKSCSYVGTYDVKELEKEVN